MGYYTDPSKGNHWGEVESGGLTRRELLRKALLAGGVLAMPGLVAACVEAVVEPTTTAPPDGPRTGGHLRIAAVGSGGAETLNPLFMPGGMEVLRAYQLYDRLFVEDPNLNYVPHLAESLEANEDSTIWQLRLKTGITFHDGKPFGADDVLYTWRYIIENETQGASFIEALDLNATRTVSDSEVEIHLSRPIGDLQSLLGGHVFSIIPDGFEDFANPNGTGPFRFDSLVPQERSRFVRNENYWGDGPYVDEVEIIVIDDTTARVSALLAGEVDAIDSVSAPLVAEIETSPATVLLRHPSPSNIPFTMRLDSEPFTDVRVRQAMRLAVDRQQVIDVALGGMGTIGNDLQGLGYPSYNDELPQREHDPEQARALLADAGHEDLRVTLHTAEMTGYEESATVLAEQAREAGITIELDKIPPGDYFNSELQYLSSPFYQSGWPYSFEFHTVSAHLTDSPFGGETTWFAWENYAEWEAEFRRAQTISDADERNEIFKELQVPLWEEGGYIVWGFQDRLDGISSNIRGVAGHPARNLGNYTLKDWWFEA